MTGSRQRNPLLATPCEVNNLEKEGSTRLFEILAYRVSVAACSEDIHPRFRDELLGCANLIAELRYRLLPHQRPAGSHDTK